MLTLALLGCPKDPKTRPIDTGSQPPETTPIDDTAASTATGDTAVPEDPPPAEAWMVGGAGQLAAYLSALDIDDDGAAELAVGGQSTVWLLSAPWSGGPLGAEADWTIPGGYGVALFADLTGDGVGDLVADSTGCGTNVLAGPLDDPFDPYTIFDADVSGSFVSCGDVDGDGDEELCVGTDFNCDIIGEEPAALVFATPLPPAALGQEHAAVIIDAGGLDVRVDAADLDGDSQKEIVVAAPYAGSGGSVWLVRDPFPGTFDVADAAAVWTGTEDSDAGEALASGDLDGDGRDDLVIGAPDYGDPGTTSYYGPPHVGRAYIVLDAVSGPLEDAPIVLTADGEDSRGMGTGLAAGDLDGDGQTDLAASEIAHWPPGPGRIAIHLGPIPSGIRTWSDADRVLVGWGPDDYYGLDIEIADLDGDGRLDLAATGTGDRGALQRPGAVHLLFGASLFP